MGRFVDKCPTSKCIYNKDSICTLDFATMDIDGVCEDYRSGKEGEK